VGNTDLPRITEGCPEGITSDLLDLNTRGICHNMGAPQVVGVAAYKIT
jgi:hypothetical protein